MNRAHLPTVWVRWRRRRYQDLMSQGLGPLAWTVAKGEAAARHRVARVIGDDRAHEASLTCITKGSRLSFALTGEIAGLSDDQAAALEALSYKAAGKPA